MKISLGTIVLVTLLVLTVFAVASLDTQASTPTVGTLTTSRTN